MSIIGFHHAQVTIPKGAEAQARAFYCDLLGLSEIEKPDSLKGRGGFWVQVGSQQLHVGTEDGIDRNATKAHLAYQVSDLDGWRTKLIAAGSKWVIRFPLPASTVLNAATHSAIRLNLFSPRPLDKGGCIP